jgi:hypothetical protein
LEKAFKIWEVGLEKQFPRELEKLEGALKRELFTARGEKGRTLVKRKLAAVRLRLNGPSAEDEPAPSPAPAKAVAAKVKRMPIEEMSKRWAEAKKNEPALARA